jgi:K+-sensing histidine kinase KdpD
MNLNQQKQLIFFGCLLAVVIVGIADAATPNYFNMTPFYLLPIVISGWRCGRRFSLWICCFTFITWCVVEFLFGSGYPSIAIMAWCDLAKMLVFGTISFLVLHMRASRDLQNRLYQEKAEAYEKLQRASKDLNELQQKYVVICAWTHKIKEGNEWVDLEEFLDRHLHLKFSHGISREVEEDIKTKIKKEYS